MSSLKTISMHARVLDRFQRILKEEMGTNPQPIAPPTQTPPTQTPPIQQPPVENQQQPPAGQTSLAGPDGKPITVDSMIDRLNVIRGGRSFKDPEVYGDLTRFFKRLPDAEKSQLDAILMEVGKIVINAQGDVSAGSQPSQGQQQPAPPAQMQQPAPPAQMPPQ
jgi:hypothetical protein